MKILGHRGDGVSNKTQKLREERIKQGKAPENTLTSFKKVFDEGADGIEFDIILTKDNKAAVIHDDEIEVHSYDGSGGLVSETIYEDLKKVDVGGGNSVPLLRDVIELAGLDKILNVELKGPNCAAKVVEVITEFVTKGWKKENFIISSFYPEQIKDVKTMDPNMQIGLLFEPGKIPESLQDIIDEFAPYSIHPDSRDVGEEILEVCKKNEVKVITWTSAEPITEEQGELKLDKEWVGKLANYHKKGYDIDVITDHPALLRKEIGL